ALAYAIGEEIAEAEAALWSAEGIELDANASEETVVPGQRFTLAPILWKGSGADVGVQTLEPVLPEGWTSVPQAPIPARVPAGGIIEVVFEVTVPPEARLTRPYFLTEERPGDLYSWQEGRLVGEPFARPPVRLAA